eukprot:5337385-Prymnesium_polylepis.1
MSMSMSHVHVHVHVHVMWCEACDAFMIGCASACATGDCRRGRNAIVTQDARGACAPCRFHGRLFAREPPAAARLSPAPLRHTLSLTNDVPSLTEPPLTTSRFPSPLTTPPLSPFSNRRSLRSMMMRHRELKAT